jgi:tight adherence protein B
MYGPLLFGVLVSVSVLVGFAALWQVLRTRDPVEGRLQEYGADAYEHWGVDSGAYADERRRTWPGINRLLAGLGLGPRLALALTRADVPLTAAEFTVLIVIVAVLGFAIGTVRVGPLLGLVVAAVCGYLPVIYLRMRGSRRQRAFTEQVPEILTLLVGGLRAGYGLSQSLEMLVDNLPAPASTEFARVMRAVELGLPIQQALDEMATRVGTDDIALVVTAINAQYEMGGNLAQVLETIGQTVRDRLHLLREIRVMTAQQRLTGYILAVWPLFLGIAIYLLNPAYISRLFEPGWFWLPVAAVVLQVLGFLVIRRIVDIEV